MSSAQLKAAVTGAANTAVDRGDPYSILKRQLEQSKHEFLPLLGNNSANVDKFIRVVLNAVMANPDLLNANRRSLVQSCMRAAQDGLLPDGREAVLNIYNTNVAKRDEPANWVKMAQYLPMVGGLIKKLYEGGEVTYVDACCVYKDDIFKYTRGDEPKIVHEPQGEGTYADIVAVYCIVKLKNGETKREVMFRKDIERVRAASKSANKGPWIDWFDQQAIKSVIKRIYKQLPRTDTFEQVADADNVASGYTNLGEAVSQDVRPAAAPAAPAAPALPNTPPDPLDTMPLGDGHDLAERHAGDALRGDGAAVVAGGEPPELAAGTQAPAAEPPPPAKASTTKAPKKPAEAPAFDYVAALGKIEQAADLEVLSLYVDTLSSELPESPDKDALMQAYRKRAEELRA